MTIDKNKLDQARQWAAQARKGLGLTLEGEAAVEIIEAVPNEFIDVRDVREIVDLMQGEIKEAESNKWFTDYHEATQDWKDALEAILPKAAPRLEIKMGAWAMHPKHGKVLISSAYATPDGMVWVSIPAMFFEDGATTVRVQQESLSPLPEGDHIDDYSESAQKVIKDGIEDFEQGRFTDFDLGDEEVQGVTTQAEYNALPAGSVVALKFGFAWTKLEDGQFLMANRDQEHSYVPSSYMSGITREVLRKGWMA